MITDITIQYPHDEPLPPPAWLVGSIVATVVFVAASLLAALPHDGRTPADQRAEPALHSGIVVAEPTAKPAAHTPIPFDPVTLSLPIL